MTAYAPPRRPDNRPRIAIVISGLGISAKATAAALAGLPPEVTLAFAPYAADVQRWVSEARRQGHEVLLEVPMEPFDFPDSDPGPHTLAGRRRRRLQYRAADLVADPLHRLCRRDQSAGRPVSRRSGFARAGDDVPGAARAAFLRQRPGHAFRGARRRAAHSARLMSRVPPRIDTIQTAMEIDQRLSELETRARANGSASGAGFLYPVTVERVADWAKGLPGRGFVLVPASAIVPRTK